MPVEIERRFLVNASLLPFTSTHAYVDMEQGYMHKDPWLRVRVARPVHHTSFPQTAYVTVKGKGTVSRQEYEMEIPYEMGLALMAGTRDRLHKHRYHQDVAGSTWVVDVYQGALAGLVTAEVELKDEDEPFAWPHWAICEVTEDKRYSAAKLGEAQRIPLDYLTLTTLGQEYVGMSEGAAKNLAELRGYRLIIDEQDGYAFTVPCPQPGDIHTTVRQGKVVEATVYPSGGA